MPPISEAGPGARHAADDRRDHLGRVQEAHREGPGADPALPGGPGRRAGRGALRAHDAQARQHPGEAPSGADPRRGDRGRGQALAPLHSGAPVAGQGGKRARYRRAPASRSASTARRRRWSIASGGSNRSRPSWRSSSARPPSASTRASARAARCRSSSRSRRARASSRRALPRRKALVGLDPGAATAAARRGRRADRGLGRGGRACEPPAPVDRDGTAGRAAGSAGQARGAAGR